MANGDLAATSLPNGHPSSVDHKITNPLWQTYDIQKLKSTQSVEVSQIIIDEGLVHTSLVLKEVDWFFNKLGIDDEYFCSTPISNIAKHISCLYAGKILAMAGGSDQHDFNLRQEENDQAFFAVRSIPGSRLSQVYDLERMIDRDYLLEGYSGTDQVASQSRTLPYRLKVFRSAGPISSGLDIQLRFYLLQRPIFSSEIRRPSYVQGVYEPADTDLVKISDKRMIARSSPTTHVIYKSVIDKAVQQLYPVVDIVSSATPGQRRLVVAYHHGSVHSFFSALTDLYHQRGLYSTKKFVEQFSNGVTVVAIYLKPLPVTDDHAFNESVVDERVRQVKGDISLIYVLPRHALTPMFSEGRLTAEEATFAYVGWKFSHQFLSRYRREYGALLSSIEKHEPSLIGHLLRLKQNLRKDTFTEERLLECIRSYPIIIKALYADFAQRHSGGAQPNTPSTPRHTDHDTEALESLIKRHATSEFDTQILLALLSFNRHILRTNFFKEQKIALSFRLSPGFLVPDEYPIVPHGVFFVVGSEFRGFHVRFTDVARGGIRIIKSRNAQAYAHNVGSIFDENYNLALTQMRKNKDIPEGGSKGTIFLSQSHQDKDDVAFRKYVDSMLDILLPNQGIRDYLQQEEILFFGPDEGTANLMDWASQHARARGAHFWKAFTTGKSMSLGGIPHDMFGMTTRSVHQYVVGVLDKLGLKEDSVSKFQTGGPDGDLGSNEILISNDKTISVVDGSGVLHDPKGIDRQELRRLAKNRKMVEHFDKSKLSPSGYFISIDSRMVTPPGFSSPIESGLVFRNTFHLLPQAKADLFVPCGGRPEAVNLNNYHEMLDENGKCRFKVIVEGANLFLTQESRLQLEKLGTIIYKDASANKGGVTSSSLEVLAALALTDDEFAEHMMVTDSKNPPAFYTAYVKQVQKVIEQNARMEFECIWREHEATGTPRCVITDLISNKINALNASLSSSTLWQNKKLRFKVLQDACPSPLTDLLGVEVLASRLPESYIQAIFGAYLAAHFVYQHGLNAPEFAFFDFMENYMHGSSGLAASEEGC